MLFEKITRREPIDKGWSGDKKYKVFIGETPYLLRISPLQKQERILRQFRLMQSLAALEIPMCRPVEYGVCGEDVYLLITWVDGRDAEELLQPMSDQVQYQYGLEAGRILQKIHTRPAPADAEDWERRFNKKIDRKIAMYEASPLKYDHDAEMLHYLEENRHLLHGRPQCQQHGDYHVGNMMIDQTGSLVIIDFEKEDWGDPWEEFNRIVWCAQEVPAMARGMVDGYFDSQVPLEFWQLLALYICSNTLGSLPWAIPFGETEVQVMRAQQVEVLHWYDHMKKVIPGWYSAD